MAEEPPTKKTKRDLWAAIAAVHGCGIRVTVNFNDSDEAASIIKMVLTNKDKDMPLLCRKFHGHKHLRKIDIDGMEFGNYSYRWKLADDEDVSCEDLKNTFEELVQFRIDPTKPYEGSNIKCKVLIVNNGDLVPMEQFFHYDDIIKAMVSNEQKWQIWRAHTGAATQPQAWFWLEPDSKDPIKKIAKAWKALQTPTKKQKLKL